MEMNLMMEEIFGALSIVFRVLQVLIVFGLILFGIIKMAKLIKKNKLFKNKKAWVVSVICMLVSTASLVFNIGFLRLVIIFALIPVMHPMILVTTNLYAAKYAEEIPKLKVVNRVLNLSYVIFWIFLPDIFTEGPSYFFFNLIHHQGLSVIAFVISGVSILVHIGCFMTQMGEIKKLKSVVR
ncbi:MAG: hypothetical protein IJB80_05790 [Clostridia bacterium]|nr:hypothetical protein [Clostridia bacterium]